jgi:chemotaxis protein CheD
MTEQLRVGIADFKIASTPDSLITLGLGSCVGVGLYDPAKKVGGLIHIMLAESTKHIKRQNNTEFNVYKYADTAIPEAIKAIEMKNGNRKRLVAKIVGGASMFQVADKSRFNIGEQNVESVKRVLKDHGIPILAEVTGGNVGRTMIVSLDDFAITIKCARKEVKTI